MASAECQWAVACQRIMFNMNKKLILCCVSLLGLTACSSAPRQVTASVPLVLTAAKPIGQKLPAKYSAELENSENAQLNHPDYSIQLGPFYTSSLGRDCRDLTIHDQAGDKSLRVVCAEKQPSSDQSRDWYLIPNIVQHASSIKL